MGQVAQADGIEPEYVVQRVVQAGRDEQTVKECIDAGADTVHADDAFANSYQSAEDDRPYEQQDNGYRDGNQMATQRLPLKNASQSGSFAFLKRL